jgi:hypothetical protein
MFTGTAQGVRLKLLEEKTQGVVTDHGHRGTFEHRLPLVQTCLASLDLIGQDSPVSHVHDGSKNNI